jgi:hypothetical protein
MDELTLNASVKPTLFETTFEKLETSARATMHGSGTA